MISKLDGACGRLLITAMKDPVVGKKMRDIKFRGKRLDNGEWVYGSLVRGVEVDDPNNVTWWIFEDTTAHQMHLVKYQHPIDPATIGQYTGLKDKNGKEIYEGDILYCISRFDNANMVVIFEDGEFRMVLCEKYKTYETGGGFYAIRCFEKEIIGNIYDNPELLE